MKKLQVIVTSGGTKERIDDVRVLTNISSGKMGAKIADIFVEHGHKVIYVAPLGAIQPSKGCHDGLVENRIVTNVDSVMEIMKDLVPKADVVIHPMAVSDFTFKYDGAVKCGSNSAEDFIEHMRRSIARTPKVISHFRRWNPEAILVGFKFTSGKSESELKSIALSLMKDNELDMVFANDKKKIEKSGEHVGTLLMKDWEEKLHGKEEIAQRIYLNVIRLLG